MHPRQRSPRGFYAPEYRHRGGGDVGVGVGFGRGYNNNNRRAAPSVVTVAAAGAGGSGGISGGGDIFMEAGRLAAEYLVSQGLLPPNVLSLKWHNQNGSFKKHVGVVGGVSVGVGEIGVDGGRPSALARLGNAGPGVDGGMTGGRRKLGFEEFGQKGVSSGGRRRGSFKSNGFDWGNREYRRNGSWSDRFQGGSDIRDDDDDVDVGSGSGVRQQDEELHREQQKQEEEELVGASGGGGGGVDDVIEKSNLNEFVPTSAEGNDLGAETDKDRVSDGELVELKQSCSGEVRDVCDMDVEFVGSSNDLENMNDEVKEVVVVKDEAGSSDEGNKPSISKNSSAQSSDQENNSSGSVFTDLLSFCKSVKVPTKTRSSLTNKNSKALPQGNSVEENVDDLVDLQGPEILAENEEDQSHASVSGVLISDMTYEVVHIDSDTAEVEPDDSSEDMKELDTACEAEEDQSIESQSDQDRGQESTAELPKYGGCSSVSEERGEKRVAEDDVDVREDTKRLREWLPLPSPIPKTKAYFLHNNTPIEVKESPEEDTISHVDKVSVASDQGSLMSSSQFTDGDRTFFGCSEKKPPLPSSFRTCDLNLIEASEVHDTHVDHPVLIYSPPVSETKEAIPVDIDLSMSRASVSGKFSTHGTDGKEIEVIDLENDSIPEEKPIDSIDRKTEAMFTGLEGFSSHAQNAADIHDVQDGYGLMISELLGTDFANCSSVPDDINSVHNEIGLDNATGTLAEDDSIYMSLGELSFLRPWEQPPSQDYQKHF
ncbi:uncharacterized protein At4g26450 [Cicer arietinum]|uniref:Uncharacterized protein At4g26450 n=1 Tax=Cicer arietinum TaxID=3827 RepID=A0A1S2Y779_CICAR|nr:uncharacterized protein At4g26450 [Cicer arietinum]